MNSKSISCRTSYPGSVPGRGNIDNSTISYTGSIKCCIVVSIIENRNTYRNSIVAGRCKAGSGVAVGINPDSVSRSVSVYPKAIRGGSVYSQPLPAWLPYTPTPRPPVPLLIPRTAEENPPGESTGNNTSYRSNVGCGGGIASSNEVPSPSLVNENKVEALFTVLI